MYWLDIAILGVLLLAAVFGAQSGLLGQVARLLALALALYGSVQLNGAVTGWLEPSFPPEAAAWLPQLIAYAVVFLAIYVSLLALTMLLEHGVKVAQMQGVNRSLGAVLGVVKAGLIVGLVVLGLTTYLPSVCGETIEKSSLAVFLRQSVQRTFDAVPQPYRDNILAQLRQLEELGAGEGRPTE
jgi:membrane protein required for colicin V production